MLGLGHVGLPTALGLAEIGWQVVGADDDQDKAALLTTGKVPFHEPGLQDILRRNLDSGRFRVASDVSTAIREATVLFVCVGTPQRDDGSADLSQIEAVAISIAKNLNGYKLIVEKSTTPVRTVEHIKRIILQNIDREANSPTPPFDVAVNPEFLRESTALADFLHPDRIVVGVESDRARSLLLNIYEPLLNGEDPESSDRLIVTDLNTAEITKHASNAFLATKISFINMVADLCEATGADIAAVASGLGSDPRIGRAFLDAGIGFGGYCLPKDLRAFARIGEEYGVDVALLNAVERINQERIERIVQKVRQALGELKGKTVGVLGLAFKPNTDDMREAPSLKILDRLLSKGVRLQLHDPEAMDNCKRLLPEEPDRLCYCESPYDAAAGAHALLLVTEWEEYAALDLSRIRELMRGPVLIDGRNLFNPIGTRALGFEYHGTGR